jgi:hypothetical protein
VGKRDAECAIEIVNDLASRLRHRVQITSDGHRPYLIAIENATNGFSKKLANHAAAISLHYMFYNYARVHKTPRVTLAMEAGVTNRVWSLEDIAGLLDSYEEKAKKKSA